MPSNMATVHAAEPSSTAYATKEELMNWDYQNTVGKIVFGKDSSGNPMQWYILGSDSGVSGDNTVIFATSPIVTGVKFEDDYQNNKVLSTWDKEYAYGGYPQGSEPTEVYPNHYGTSDLRAILNEMASNNDCFTVKEQLLLLATSVTTTDTRNNSESYTTTDKLYALHGDSYNNITTLYAGSDNGKALAMSTYWNDISADWFWLRGPDDNSYDHALVACPGYSFDDGHVVYGEGVQPASNLNLSSVIFASAAPAASSDAVEAGTIQTDKAMTLRLDGSNIDIGNVIYDSARGNMIFVKKSANATGTVSLVVQGNDGSNDWYYSKVVTDAEIIHMSDIKTALNLSADISVDDCKIWLETTVDGMAYAKQMQNGSYTCIDEINVSIDAPTLGEALASDITVQNTGVVSIAPATKWTVGTTEVTGTADYDTAYTVTMNFATGDREYFDDTLTATVNGEPATITKNTDGTATVSYTFPAIEKDKLISITQPQRLTVANKTAYEDMNLPTTVAIETDKGNVTQAAVIWNTTAPIDGSYDPAVLTEQTVILKGTVTCPDSVDANGVTLETKILITISAAGVTGAPAVSPAAGTYTENQTVSLSTTTEGATIYYTTDGTEPSKTNGAVYTTPISITGTKGQSVTVTIKAIAVKDGMQDSAVQTFTYTINLPADSEPGTVPPTPQPEDDNPAPNPNTDDTTTEEGKDEVPKTGDASSPVIPFMLMLASASCMLLLMTNSRMGKKHEKNKSEQ